MARITRDSYELNRAKNYKRVIFQEGVTAIDAEHNEAFKIPQEDFATVAEMLLFSQLNVGLNVKASTSSTNNFKVTAGPYYAAGIGMSYSNQSDFEYTNQPDWSASHVGSTSPATLAPPVTGTRLDTVYAEFFLTEITAQAALRNSDGFLGDEDLIDAVYGQENCIRSRLVCYIKVVPGISATIPGATPTDATGHYSIPIAYIRRTTSATITDAMIEVFYNKKPAGNILSSVSKILQNTPSCIIGTSASLVPTATVDGFANDIITIGDLAEGEYLKVKDILVPKGRLVTTPISMEVQAAPISIAPNTMVQIGVHLNTSTMLLEGFIQVASAILGEYDVVLAYGFYGSDSIMYPLVFQEFIGYGNGSRTEFLFSKTNALVAIPTVPIIYKDTIPVAPGDMTVTTTKVTFNTAPLALQSIKAAYAYGTGVNINDTRKYFDDILKTKYQTGKSVTLHTEVGTTVKGLLVFD